ncbi:GntR family transcriptional regulator [Marinovum sp.]|uniref:GntR family transcriptional regulator n=1 Tax=Marinovum sp. TaxID=2024839 RepID=UPI003A91B531
MQANEKSSESIANVLRADICLGVSADAGMLHEGQLAKRFGVSRTPVRQALQRLGYERLITVKSGVGSIIVPLNPPERTGDVLAATALLEAIAKCASRAAAPKQHFMALAGLSGILDMDDVTNVEDFFEVRARFLAALSDMVENPILDDAFRAAYWRLIRWSVKDFANDPEGTTEHLRRLLRETTKSLHGGSVADAMSKVAAIESEMAAPTGS